MADPVPSGSDVSSGTYRCTNCGYELSVSSSQSGDSTSDPYPSG